MEFQEQLRLYEKAEKVADFWQFKIYDYHENVYDTSSGKKVLKTWGRGDFYQTREMALGLYKTGLIEVSLPHFGKGESYLLEDTYYLVDQPKGRAIDPNNLFDLAKCAEFLAKLHQLSLYKTGDKVLSIHIVPKTFYIGENGRLLLSGFEKLRVENPLLSLAHLLYDLESIDLNDFALQKYEAVNPVDKAHLSQSRKLIWESAMTLGLESPKKSAVLYEIDKLQELVGMLWPLIDVKEYTNLPVSQYYDSREISSISEIKISEPIEADPLGNQTAAEKLEDETDQAPDIIPEAGPELSPSDEELIANADSDKTADAHESGTKSKKSESLMWKPFPKLPDRRW